MPFTYQEAGELYNTTDTIYSNSERIEQATKTLADIAAINPSNLRGYLFVCIKDANDDGTVECVVYNGGTNADKEVMLEALGDTLAKQQARRAKRSPAVDGRKDKGVAQ